MGVESKKVGSSNWQGGICISSSLGAGWGQGWGGGGKKNKAEGKPCNSNTVSVPKVCNFGSCFFN